MKPCYTAYLHLYVYAQRVHKSLNYNSRLISDDLQIFTAYNIIFALV